MTDSQPIRFSLRQIRYFVVAAEALSFTAAAKQLHISQPSISTALSELESAFGVQLFLRHHAQGLSLTQAGRDILAKARDLLRYAEELESSAGAMNEGLTGTITLGCLSSLAPLLVPSLISAFAGTYSGIAFRTDEGHQDMLLQGLRTGLLDVALTYDLDLTDDVKFVPLMGLPPYAILPKTHRLAGRRNIRIRDLASDPYIMLDMPHSREYFSSLFTEAETRPVIAFRSTQSEVVRGMVANGLGYSILNFPLKSTATADGKEFAVAQFKDKLRQMRLGLAYSNSAQPRLIVRRFASFCAETISQPAL